MKNLGDFDPGTVIYGKFTTYQPSTGAVFALAGTPALSVYKDNSTTQSTSGVTLTASFDSVTGLNHYTIDTSADGTFYAAGGQFDIVITTGTVDSVSVVGAVVGSFTLRKDSSLKPTTASRTLDVASTGEAGVDFDNVLDSSAGAKPYLGVIDQGTAQAATSTTIQLRAAAAFADSTLVGAVVMAFGSTQGYWQVRTITAYVGSTDTATVDAWTVTPSGTITYKVLAAPPSSASLVPAVNVTQVDGVALDTHDAGAFPADVRLFGGVAGTFSGGRPEVNTTHAAGTAWNSGAISASTLAADTLTAAKVAADVGTEIAAAVWAAATRTLTANPGLDAAAVRAAIGLASANLDAQIGTLATASNLATVASYIDTEVAAIQAVTDKLDTTLQANSGIAGYRFSEEALSLAPTGGGGTAPTVQEIVDGVWDEPIASHLTSGSTGAALNGAGAAGDPWTTPLPGAYGAGTAGFIVGTNLDAQVSAVKAKTDALPTDPADESLVIAATDAIFNRIGAPVGASISADIADVQSSTLNAAGVRAAVGLATANLDTQLSGINAKTTNLPSDPADQSLVIAATTAIYDRIGAPAGLSVSADIAAVKADTGAGATAAALATVAGNVTAVKAKTDSLAFTVAGQVDANVQYVNDAAVTGNGQPGTEWGPA